MKALKTAVLCAPLLFAAAPGHADLSATLDIANLYLFRGVNLSQGSPMVAGSLDYSHASGAFAGIWSASGDDALGTEVDYYAGFLGKAGELGYKVQYLNYYYPQNKAATDFNDYAELSAALDIKGVSFSLSAPTSDDFAGDYFYYNLGYSLDKFTASVGLMDNDTDASDYSHFDLKYQFNDNLSFVVSQILDTGKGSSLNDAAVWQVNYRLPISLN